MTHLVYIVYDILVQTSLCVTFVVHLQLPPVLMKARLLSHAGIVVEHPIEERFVIRHGRRPEKIDRVLGSPIIGVSCTLLADVGEVQGEVN
jgi:hypothetical protein